MVNPDYKMVVDDIELHIMQPNSRVVLERFTMRTSIEIRYKEMNATITIPNKFRNNTLTYVFEINMDSDLFAGDYMKISVEGNWTFFLEDCVFIEGVNSDN